MIDDVLFEEVSMFCFGVQLKIGLDFFAVFRKRKYKNWEVR
jgi:hypothetical protein